MGRSRQEMSAEEREEERAKDRQRMARKRQAMSDEERGERLAMERQRIARIRQAMSIDKRQEVRDKERQRMAKRRQAMSDEERKELLAKERQRFARKRLVQLAVVGQELLATDRQRKMRRKQMARNENARNQQRMTAESSNQCYSENSKEQQCTEQMQIDGQQFDDNRHMISTQVSQMTSKSLQIASQMPVQQYMNVAQASHISVPKPKDVRKPWHRRKRILAVADHQCHVMSNLAALWKSKKLCDAGIGNGSSTVMVHKVVLSAVCPKLLSVFSTNISSQKFLQINFPEEVSTQALNAFAEYMYNGHLDLDPDILQQLKIIAKRLEMKKFEQMCNSHLPDKINQPSTNLSQSQTQANLSIPPNITVPTVQPSLPSSSIISVTSQSAPSVTTQVLDVKQETSEAELAQVKKVTAAVFAQESEVASLDANTRDRCSNGSDFVPRVKTERVGPDNEKYGQLNNEAYTSTPVSSKATTNVIHGTLSKLKSNVFESSLVSDVSPVSCIEEKMCSLSSPIREDSSKLQNRTITTQSIDNIGSNEGIYPIGLFTAGGNNLPLSIQFTNLKQIGLYKTDDLT